jgi:hypothetical protein
VPELAKGLPAKQSYTGSSPVIASKFMKQETARRLLNVCIISKDTNIVVRYETLDMNMIEGLLELKKFNIHFEDNLGLTVHIPHQTFNLLKFYAL